MNNKVTGYKAVSKGTEVVISINDEVVHSAGQKLAIALMLCNDSVQTLLTKEQAEECFCYALKVVLRQNSGAKPSFELIPTFLSDITMSLTALYRGVVIRVNELDAGERPNSYSVFLDVLSSLNIPVGKPLKVHPEEKSNVLKVGVCEVNGADTLVGLEPEIQFEELVVRAMLDVSNDEQEKISRIVGHLDNIYCSRDEVIRNWAGSLPVASRG